MFALYPKAVVLTSSHPYGGTQMMARSLVAGLESNGYQSLVVNMNDSGLQRHLPALLDPELALVITTGTMPLALQINGKPIWRAVSPSADFLAYIIDAWPYDHVRVPPFRDFLNDWQQNPALHVASLERNDARLIGPRAHYFPTGAYAAPWSRGPKANPARLMIWGSANKELAVTAIHDDFESTIRENNHWGFDPVRISSVSDALRNSTTTHGLSAIAEAIGETVEALVRPDAMVALCAIDSCLKRYRRVKVARALRGMPVDFYGENWKQHVGDCTSYRFFKPVPDHNHAFSHICQQYAGLVNFDPNFGHGTNERAVTALAMGIPIANNFNLRTDPSPACFPYHFQDASIRFAAERLLAYTGLVEPDPCHTWEYLVRVLLREIADPRKPPVPRTAPARAPAEAALT